MLSEKRFIIALTLALIVMFLYLIRPFWYPLTLAAVITVLFHPLYVFFVRLFRKKTTLASIAATIVIFISLILPASILVTIFVDQAQNLSLSIGTSLNNGLSASGFSERLTQNLFYQQQILPFIDMLEKRLHIDIDLWSLLVETGKKATEYAYAFSPQVLSKTASFIMSFFIMLVAVFVFFLEGPRLSSFLISLSPLRDSYDRELLAQFKNTIYGTVYGYLLTALVQGVLAAIGFGIAGIPAAIVLGVMTFFASIVPLVGATGIWLPVAIWQGLSGNIGTAIGIGLYGALIISGIDNILKPLIMNGRIRIHPFLIFLSLFGGMIWLGPMGILLGPMTTAILAAALNIYREEFIK